MNGFLFLVLIIVIYFVATRWNPSYQGIDAPRKGMWWEHLKIQPASVEEGFQEEQKEEKKEPFANFPEYTEVLDLPPSMAGPANLMNQQPYLLLEDMAPQTDLIDEMTSQHCYETDFNHVIEKVGNYRQFTNLYKRGHPDSAPQLVRILFFPFMPRTLLLFVKNTIIHLSIDTML